MAKKIITTVGTSIFTNYYEEMGEKNQEGEATSDHETLKKRSHSLWKRYSDEEIPRLRAVISSWANGNDQASAEISSLLKIADKYKDEELEVYLIATDTVLSRLAAELVQEWFEGKMTVHFNPKKHVISGLSVEQAGAFIEQGVQGLVQTILDIRGKGEDSMLLNISGGYKGLIPVMTIVGQLYDMNICYTYEDSEELIEIPRMPLNFDWDVMEQYAEDLLRLNKLNDKPEIGAELQTLHLVTKQNGQYVRTILGTLITQFLNQNPPFFGTQFGYFIEYKLKKYYDSSFGCQKVLHGYKPDPKLNEDVDIAILDGSGGFTAIEIKPFERVSEPELLTDFMHKLTKRAMSMGEQKQLTVKELRLFTYKFQLEGSSSTPPELTPEQRILLSQVAEEMNKQIPGVKFTCHFLMVERNKIKSGNRIPYQKFLKEEIDGEQIKILFSAEAEIL